jgi:DNA-directed RNA polymerase specialized sigma subunit
MYLFDDDDLRKLVRNTAVLSFFKIEKKNQQILHMRLFKGRTFQFIGGVFGITKQTVHRRYCKSLGKIRDGMIEIVTKVAEENSN